MELAGYVVNAVVLEGRSVREVAKAHGVSKTWLYELLARHKALGDAGLGPRSKRPRSSPGRVSTAMEDDHKPFMELGVPSADLIDFTYGYNNVFWHTKDDTVDKLSPKSLEIVGKVTLQTVQLIDKR